MELSNEIQKEILSAFKNVSYGSITFILNGDEKHIDYKIEQRYRIARDNTANR